MGKEIKVWYDKEGDYLEVIFERKAGYFRQTENDAVMEKVEDAWKKRQATIIGNSDASRETSLVAEKIGLMLAKHGTIRLILTKQAYPISYRQSTQF